jgi:serine/threonine protein kinase
VTTALLHPDRVTLLREISEGPISALFAGERRRGPESRLVAVKVLRHRRARDAEQLHQLHKVARRLDRIGHRNVVAATDLAVIDGRPALLSPWVEGVDLLDWVEVLRETDIALPTRVVCEILRSVASALDAALNRTAWGDDEPLGLLHRDVKPSNIMISRDGHVLVLDFGTGLSSLAGRDGRVTARKAGLGRYLSPGRRPGKRGGSASDVYALGLIGVELFSGRWLQRVRDANPAHDRHLAEVVASLPDLGTRAPADDRTLRSLLLRMVAFDPEARPSAAEVIQTLRTLADRAPGPSLESFAHANALPYAALPERQSGLPDGVVIEPEMLASLVLVPDEPEHPPEPEPDELEVVWDDDDEPDVHVTSRAPLPDRAPRSVVPEVVSAHVAPAPITTEFVREAPEPLAPAPGTPAPRVAALSVLAGTAIAAVALAAAAGLAVGVLLGLLAA